MKHILIFTFSIFFMSCNSQTKSYEDEIKQFQYELNTEFADKDKSPLTEEGFKLFKGLDFFEIDRNYRVEAEFTLTPNTPIFEMQTTTDRLPLYRKYGIVKFTLNGREFKLSIYQNQNLMITVEYANYLFLPFNDLTNGTSSYGGGRYIDLEIPEKESRTIIIDFNKAYNPYCAYNHKYSCPIPPKENDLDIAIPVGVKLYNKQL